MQFRSSVHTITEEDREALTPYREYIRGIVSLHDTENHEGALAFHEAALTDARAVTQPFSGHRHMILVGIGGSSLGLEAVHGALGEVEGVMLHVIDSLSIVRIEEISNALEKDRASLTDIVVVIISKSGGTTETIANASLLLSKLSEHFGEGVADRVIAVSDEGSKLAEYAKSAGYRYAALPHAIGGRYSVFTTVGLVPFILLGHNVEELLRGAEETILAEMEGELPASYVAAHLLARSAERAVTINDTFVFDTRLRAYALWRRQLMGESLGKSKALDGRAGIFGPVPTVSTLVDLHSVGQLYLSGFRGIHTDFISCESYGSTDTVSGDGIASLIPHIAGKTVTEITNAIYTGVTESYRECNNPFNEYVIASPTAYEMGALMAFNMLETMYAAELLGVDAFDQPNVELYKIKTRAALES